MIHTLSQSRAAAHLARRLARPLRAILLALVLLGPAYAPAPVLAQQEEGAVDEAEGRLRGYEESGTIMAESSTALTYFLLVALTALAVGVMFKSARRTHLD